MNRKHSNDKHYLCLVGLVGVALLAAIGKDANLLVMAAEKLTNNAFPSSPSISNPCTTSVRKVLAEN